MYRIILAQRHIVRALALILVLAFCHVRRPSIKTVSSPAEKITTPKQLYLPFHLDTAFMKSTRTTYCYSLRIDSKALILPICEIRTLPARSCRSEYVRPVDIRVFFCSLARSWLRFALACAISNVFLTKDCQMTNIDRDPVLTWGAVPAGHLQNWVFL